MISSIGTFDEGTFGQAFEVDRVVTTNDGPGWCARQERAPGRDSIPMGFLKACGEPLYRTLASLALASHRLTGPNTSYAGSGPLSQSEHESL
jgi:hypothetical protein